MKAIRLLDDENDIFSTARCALLPEVSKDLIAQPGSVLTRVRTVLTSKVSALPFATTQPKRAAYFRALLSPQPDAAIDDLENAYLTELVARFNAADKTDKAVLAKETARKKLARLMFPARANPLPILDPP